MSDLIIIKVGKYDKQDWIDNFTLLEDLLEQLRTDTDLKLASTEKAANNGVASLNNDGKVVQQALDSDKIDGKTWSQVVAALIPRALLASNNTILYKDSDGDIGELVVGTSKIVGRKSSGEISALSVSEVKTLLNLAIADVATLQAALDNKSDVGHTHTVLSILGTPDPGWESPSGARTKSSFNAASVTLEVLGRYVSAMYDALASKGIIGS